MKIIYAFIFYNDIMCKEKVLSWLNDKPYTKAMYLTALFTIILALSTVYFSYLQNEMAEKEFELQMRPYVIIESITPFHNNNFSNYSIMLKNIGNIPADIESIIYEYKKDTNLIHNSSHEYSRGLILGKDHSTEVMILNLPSSKIWNITIVIDYKPAIDNFGYKEYSTSGSFEHSYGTTWLNIIGNYMT